MAVDRNRAYAPHCDSSVLHAPGRCEHCDKYADWQEYRLLARIQFTDLEPNEHASPCPSSYFRINDKVNLWPGNRASHD